MWQASGDGAEPMEDGDEEVASDGDEDSAGEEPTAEEDEVEQLGGEDAPPQCCQAVH